jgi:hypothetical protein
MKLLSNRANPVIFGLPFDQLLIQLFLQSNNVLSGTRLVRNILNIINTVFLKLNRGNHDVQKSVQIRGRILTISIGVQKDLLKNLLLSLVPFLMHVENFLNWRVEPDQSVNFKIFCHYKN